MSGLLLHWQLWLGTYSAGFLFFSQVCRPLRFQSFPQTHLWEEFLLFGNFSSFTTPSPGRVSVPNSFVSLFVFYILSYLLSKRMGCLSGCLVSSTSVQKLFCGSCSAFKWSFDEFVGEKVVSPSYSSAILGPPPEALFKWPHLASSFHLVEALKYQRQTTYLIHTIHMPCPLSIHHTAHHCHSMCVLSVSTPDFTTRVYKLIGPSSSWSEFIFICEKTSHVFWITEPGFVFVCDNHALTSLSIWHCTVLANSEPSSQKLLQLTPTIYCKYLEN